MPSFDIVSKVDAQALDNAVNVTTKEITNRFDFKGSHVVINLDKKEFKLNIEAADDMKIRQLIDVLINRAHKQGIAPEAFDLSKEPYQSGKVVKQEPHVSYARFAVHSCSPESSALTNRLQGRWTQPTPVSLRGT